MNLKGLKENYGITANKVTSLRSNVAIVETEGNEKTILKKIRKSKSSNFLNRHRFFNELRIYKVIQKNRHTYFHAPELIDFGPDHMILQYVKRCDKENIRLSEFIKAYYEMQTLNVPFNFWFDLKNQSIRGFYYRGLIVPLFTLTRHLKIKKVAAIIFQFLKLSLKTKKCTNRYWLHGDLTSHNVYYNVTDNKLYFLDFENLFYTRKWPFLEIIQRCFWLKDGGYDFHVDMKYLNFYLNHATIKGSQDFTFINLENQIRFCLLMTSIQNIAIAKSKIKRDSFKLLLDISLDNTSYKRFFNERIKPTLRTHS